MSVHSLSSPNGRALLQVYEVGATLLSLQVEGRDGLMDHVALGYASLESYHPGGPGHRWHMGNTIGRNANRIDGKGFDLDGKHYDMELNNAPAGIPCHLHGGSKGFGKCRWSTVELSPHSVTFELFSPDGDQHYPGDVTARVTYSLREPADDPQQCTELEIRYHATTTAEGTIFNPTNHTYWNLTGHRRCLQRQGAATTELSSVTDHWLWLPSSSAFTPTTAGLITTGEVLPISMTLFDFATAPRTIADALETDNTGGAVYAAQRDMAGGIDHNFCVDAAPAPGGLRHAARLEDRRESGIVMDVYTTSPGIQVYTGNFLEAIPDGPKGHEGLIYGKRSAICLETQFWPNAVNHPSWQQPVLRRGQPFEARTLHRFFCRST